MKILIMGCDRVTNLLASSLVEEGHKVTVIASDADQLDTLSREAEVEVILSKGSLMEDLRAIDITSVDVFLALSDDDNWNAMAGQVASHIFHIPDVICHVEDPERQEFYHQLGIRAVCPTVVVADAIKSAMLERK